MLKPSAIKHGDRVRIVSPSGKVKKEKVLPAIGLLRQSGFDVLTGKHIFDTHFQLGGTDEHRLADLQEALDDPDCKAIICSRGGYGSIRIADKINLDKFRENPKWLVGFSDITTLHALLQKEGFCSIHGAMPAYYLKDDQATESFNQLINALTEQKVPVEIPAHPFNRTGSSTGQLVGGNLSILYSLMGTPFEPDTDGKILFIEDLSEYLYHLDRMMHSLKLAGKLKKLKGLIVGSFTEMKDNDSPFGQIVEEIIINAVKEYGYPVCFDYPAGHIDQNLPLVFGAEYEMKVDGELATITQM